MSEIKNTKLKDRRAQFTLPQYLGFSIALITTVVLLGLTWQLIRNASQVWIGVVLVSLCVPALQQALLRSPWKLPTAWCYRVAFLISASLGVDFWNHHGFWQLIGVIFSAYLGGLLAIALEYGLWEINLPPPLHVKNEVRQHHLQLIGKPRSGPLLKHLFDAIVATTGLILFAPLWLLIIFLIWFEDPGPIFFVKNSVGKGGINFSQIKFRTMISNAEEKTGPIWSSRHDKRVLLIGRFLRKTALDELPQLINILRGEMSFVGPRPQRTVLVHGYLKKLPQYTERHRVRPGISGLAQVFGHYYVTPPQKLRYDRIYVRHVSIGLDLKLLMLAFIIVFWLRWKKERDDKILRVLLRIGHLNPANHTDKK